jgi:hypothetical protein
MSAVKHNGKYLGEFSQKPEKYFRMYKKSRAGESG